MKVKNVKLTYNILNYDWNAHKVRNYNVLAHLDLDKIRKKILKKEISNYEELKTYLRNELIYVFWCRSEFEIIVGDLSCREDTFEKIDGWRQIEMNLDLIVNYVITEMKIDF